MDDLKNYVEKFAPERLRKEFRQLARPCIRGETKKAEMVSLRPGESRIGGLPDLPKGVSWPDRKGKPLAFIAQLDLASLAGLDDEGLLPRGGFLYFFYDALDQPWGFRPSDRDGWLVFHHDGPASDLVRTGFPENLKRECRFSLGIPSFARGMSFPESDTFYATTLAMTPSEEDQFRDIEERVRETFPAGGHQILGYAQAIQSSMEAECELTSNGVDCGGTGPPDPRAASLRSGASKWRLLLHIDSDDNTGMMWGDVGRLYVWIQLADLKKGDFSRVWIVLQCT